MLSTIYLVLILHFCHLKIIVRVPAVDFHSCRVDRDLGDCGELLAFGVSGFHSFMFRLDFILYSEVVCTNIVFSRSLVLLSYVLEA